MDHSYSVIYFSAAGLFDFLAKNTFGKRDEIDEDALSHICSCDLLIIDDLGTELANSFTVSQLFVILNERILRKEATIISTNLSLEDIKAIYSERIFSRISSSYSMLRLTGDDIRIQKKDVYKRQQLSIILFMFLTTLRFYFNISIGQDSI